MTSVTGIIIEENFLYDIFPPVIGLQLGDYTKPVETSEPVGCSPNFQ